MTTEQLQTGPDTNQRVYALHARSPWLPVQTLYALADSGLTDQDISASVEAMRQASVKASAATAFAAYGGPIANRAVGVQRNLQSAAQTTFGTTASFDTTPLQAAQRAQGQVRQQQKQKQSAWQMFFEDPVLQKHPSAALALKQYLSGAIGAWPIQDKDLGHLQQQLQIQGYGRDLKANGVNSPGWDAALAQWKNDLYNRQLSGERPGGISLGHAMEALQALTPVSAWNALVGFATQLPDAARQIIADAAGGAVGAFSTLNPFESRTQAQRAGNVAAADVENFFGGNTTAAEIHKNILPRVVNDMTNILMTTSVFGASGRFADTIRGLNETGGLLSVSEAERGPGVIAKLLSSTTAEGAARPGLAVAAPRAVAGAALGGVGATLAGATPAQVALAAGGGAALGAVSNTNAFQNIPVLGATGPFIDKLADADGFYYRARSILAAPYKLNAVQAADAAFQKSLLLGAEARGLAQLDQWISPNQPTGFQQAVQGEDTLDTVNDAIKNRLGFTILGQHIAPSLDDLQFLFAGKGAEAIHAAPSTDVGKAAQAVRDLGVQALGDTGLTVAIQHANGNKSIQTLVNEAGGWTNWRMYWDAKVKEAATYMLAQQRRYGDNAAQGFDLYEPVTNPDRLAALRDTAHEIRHDPAQLDEAMRLARANINQLSTNLQKGVEYNAARGITSAQDIRGWVEANKLVQSRILPFLQEQNALVGASEDPTKLGLARVANTETGVAETLTRQDAHVLANEYTRQWSDIQQAAQEQKAAERQAAQVFAGTTATQTRNVTQEEFDLQRQLDRTLYEEFGVRAQDIPHTAPDEKIQLMHDLANHLASGVTVDERAPDVLHAAVRELRDTYGYKLVHGTDIGFMLHDPTDPINLLDGALSFQRRLAEHLGLNPNFAPDAPIASQRWMGMLNEIQNGVTKGDIRLPTLSDPTTVLAYLQHEDVIRDKTPIKDWIRDVVRTPQRVAKRQYGKDYTAADLDEVRAELDHPIQLRDASRKSVVRALQDNDRWAEFSPATAEAKDAFTQAGAEYPPFMDRSSAEHVYEAIVRGSANPPGYMLGMSKLEDMFRASLGFAGKGVGDNRLGWAIANMPNRLVQLRNEFRFDLSPYFSFRRISKVNAKMAAAGITPTLDPLKIMRDTGTLGEDRNVLERIFPEFYNRQAAEAADTAGRYLESQDVFGFYNQRDFEAYAAGQLARQGMNDDDIRKTLVKVFDYGQGGVPGRTALERSTNFLFFPFSFDKTLYRNLGYYLLDRPAQRYLITAGLAAYSEFNKEHPDNPLSTEFLKNHLPILQEVERLNALAHGISMGEVGGINRPLLNLFLPQAWAGTTSNSNGLLDRFIPAVKDFGRVWSEVQDQAHIAYNTFENASRDLQGVQSTWANPGRSTLNVQAQKEKAFAMYDDWTQAYKDYIDQNAHTQNPDEKIRFPVDPKYGFGKFGGEPITKQNIRKIIALRYPAFNPEEATIIATSRASNFQDYLLDLKGVRLSDGTNLHDYVAQFAKDTDQLSRDQDNPSSDVRDMALRTAQLRNAAIYLANQDPNFYRQYDKMFRKTLGPLESVNQ